MNTSILIVTILISIALALILQFTVKKLAAKKNKINNSVDTETDRFTNPETSSINLTSNKKKSTKKKSFIAFFIFALTAIIPILIFTNGCENDYRYATFVIQDDNENYVYSSSEFLVEEAINKNEVPPTLNSNILYFIDGGVFMQPQNIENVANILSGNNKFIKHQESSFNGYAVEDSIDVYDSYTQNKAGDKIGKTEVINVVSLSKNNNSNEKMEIKWKTTPDLVAIQNCTIEDIWVVTNPYPGKTVGNWEDEILVNIELINQFYNNQFEIV
ncbi:MAG: hypothetical protein WEA99_12610, partial [Brumimicrobium sp.]